ncbi:MAG: DUF6093 family protein [Actinoallomurus sp.]
MPLTGVGAQIFHPHWNDHHRPTATAAMDAECIISRATGTGTTAADGTYTPAARTTIYTGVCRVVAPPLINEGIKVAGEAQETHRHYQVGVRYDCPELLINDLIELTVAVDAGLAGKKFRVVDLLYGSEQWQRNVLCDEREA